MERNPTHLIVRKGFTLLELTVVTTIMILLATIFLANFRGGEKSFALKRSAHRLSQDLRMAQEMALSSQKTSPEFGPETFPQGGYGIYFEENSNSYILFADCDGDKNYDASGVALDCLSATDLTPYPEKIKELSLEEGIKIASLSPFSPLAITFFPPDPTTTIKHNESPYQTVNSASIFLVFNSQTKKVSVNAAGLIEVE